VSFSKAKLGARFGACSIIAVVAMGFVGNGSSPGLLGLPAAQAQNIGQRVVSGIVEDGNSAAVAGATVFLKDIKDKTIRSYTSDAKGKFRFAQVNMAEDHELWAEKDGKKSPTKTVSSWDARKEFETELKIK
jgi:hypothetical protein